MRISGLVNASQQRHFINTQWGAIKRGCVCPLKPKKITQSGWLKDVGGVRECLNGNAAALVPLAEASVVVSCAGLASLISCLRNAQASGSENSLSRCISITSDEGSNAAEKSDGVLGSADMLGGYVQYRKRHNHVDKRYVTLQRINICLKDYELESVLSFLQHIAEKVAGYEFPYGACTFEYIDWPRALEECRFPAFIVVVTEPNK